MGRFATGVTVITAEAGGRTHAMTANAFMSGSLDPPLCVIAVAHSARMYGHLTEAGVFGVNILAAGQQDLATHFGGHPIAGLDVAFANVGGVPTLAHASAWLTAETVATHACGDHTIFIGRIRQMMADDRAPLVFHAGHFGTLVTGRESPAAPELW
jgi:flavin reductase (DIM6/NTAB) family NADH-FMN oxidoreductase RutF